MNLLSRILLTTGSVLCFAFCLLGQTNKSLDENSDFKVTPERFLHQLKSVEGEMPGAFSMAPDNWLTKQNVLALFSHVYDGRCSSSALSTFSSSILTTRTSVGHEARRLIMGYCDQHYPQVVNGSPIDVAELKERFRQRLETEDDGASLWIAMAPKIDRAVAASKARRARELLVVFSGGSWGRSAMYEDEMLVSYSKQQGVFLDGATVTYEQLAETLQQRSIACLILNLETPQEVTLGDVREVLKGIASQFDPSEKHVVFDLDDWHL